MAAQLKEQLEPLVREAGLSSREQTMRKTQESRFMEDYRGAVQSFTDVCTSYQVAIKKYGPAPASRVEQQAGPDIPAGGAGREEEQL